MKTKMFKNLLSVASVMLVASLLVFSAGCKKEKPKEDPAKNDHGKHHHDHDHDHDHDEVAEVVLNFKDAEGKILTYSLKQEHGKSEEQTVELTGLKRGKYNVDLEFKSEKGNSLNSTIFKHHKDEHFVYYFKAHSDDDHGHDHGHVHELPGITYADNDATDSKGVKLGRNTVWDLHHGGFSVVVYLIHEPKEKNPNAPKPEVLGGEIEAKAKFILKIK